MSIFIISFVVLAIIFLISSIKIVRQSHVGIVERLGRYHKQLNPGFHIVIPLIDSLRYNVDLRTQVLGSPYQPVITKDNVGMNINTVTYFRTVDPFKSVYEIENLEEATLNIISTTLRDIFGSLELDETLISRDKINNKLQITLNEATDNWGIRIERVEVKDIDPPKEIRTAMESQMMAEREKREKILRAEGFKTAQILEAQGQKESVVLAAQGEKEAAIEAAKGKAKAIELVAEAEKMRIELVYDALKNANLDEAILSFESIQAMKKVAESDNKMVVPYESVNLMGTLASIKEGLKK